MKTLQLALPPRFSLTVVVLAMVIWGIQHPSEAVASQPATTIRTNWALPVKTPANLVNNYWAPATKYASGHRGIDYRVTDKQQILAPNDGEVGYVGLVAKKPVLTIVHLNDLVTSFEPVCSVVLTGQKVKRGQVIGHVCGSISYRSHCQPKLCLHYGIRHAGRYLSPLGVAGALPPSHTISLT